MDAKNLLIRASAGTGKTFSLATRFILLMVSYGVNPSEIIALTFSRAAAQEIYTKLLERLWTASSSEEAARVERSILFGSDGNGPQLDASGFATLLRKVTDSQHLGNIATLDSFILRLVRNYPLELGFQSAVRLMDDLEEENEFNTALVTFLAGPPDSDFADVLKASQDVPWSQNIRKDILKSVKYWREFVLSDRAHMELTEEGMAELMDVGGVKSFEEEAPACLSGSFLAPSGDKNIDTICKAFVKTVSSFNAHMPKQPESIVYGAFWRMLQSHPEADAEFSFVLRNKPCTCRLDKERACMIAADYLRMKKLVIRSHIHDAAARIRLVGLIERIYDRRTRQAGLLTFGDLPRIRSAVSASGDEAAMLNLEYRFDSRFNHWVLDEFQDTSALQWASLYNLVQGAADSTDKSVVTVGDLKQAIYAWRGGNDEPFKEMMTWPSINGLAGEVTDGMAFGRILDNDVSYRYKKNICDFINLVFGEDNMRGTMAEMLPAARHGVIDLWLDEICWREHKPDVFHGGERKGELRDDDYIKVVEVLSPDGNVSKQDDDETANATLKTIAPEMLSELQRLWAEHEEIDSTDKIGILVRKNEYGQYLATFLRRHGLPVVWEGVSDLMSAPAVSLTLELLSLAEHPDNSIAWRVLEMSPLSETIPLFAKTKTILPSQRGAYLSKAVAKRLSNGGLARTVGEMVSWMCGNEKLDGYSRQQLAALTRAAVSYERAAGSNFSIGEFRRFLARRKDRTLADSPRVIRILSIHRSKGLTFDHVFVPVVDADILKPRAEKIIADANGQWAFSDVTESDAQCNPLVDAAYGKVCDGELLEALHTLYVALTRASKAMTVYLDSKSRDDSSLTQFLADAIARSEGQPEKINGDAGSRIIYERGEKPKFECKKQSERQCTKWNLQPCAGEPTRSNPSKTGLRTGFSASPFAVVEESAVERGIRTHELFEQIEWATRDEIMKLFPEGATPSEDFMAAFTKTQDVTGLWREKAYELLHNGESATSSVWVSGQIDRVVFFRGSRAVVYDFKSNAWNQSWFPTKDSFAEHLAKIYRSQMAAYRFAVRSLTGCEEVESFILSTAIGEAVRVS